jgi:hypothetical protein
MNEDERTKRLNDLISFQAEWLRQLSQEQRRLELHRDGLLPSSDDGVARMATAQAQLASAARNIADAIRGTVQPVAMAAVEVQSFFLDLKAAGFATSDEGGLRGALEASDDWRRDAAAIARDNKVSMWFTTPNILTIDVMLTLVDILDRHGFTASERRAVISNVRVARSKTPQGPQPDDK